MKNQEIKMEPWQTEIKRLDKMRLELGLNFNKLEQLTTINRGQLKKIFNFTTIPSLKLYLEIQSALVSEMNVVLNQTKVDGSLLEGNVPKMENKPLPPSDKKGISGKEFADATKKAFNECDCRLENGLLKRGKVKCKLSKAEHNF
jgi:hypothetical protein